MVAITPELLVLTVKSLVTLGVAARDQYEQHVRDQPAEIPLIKAVTFDQFGEAKLFFRQHHHELVIAGGPYAEYWDHDAPPPGLPKDRFRAEIIEAFVQESRRRPPTDKESWKIDPGIVSARALILQQWPDDRKPPPPGLRVALALAGVALDFVSLRPDLLGAKGNAAELLQAVAGNLHDALPDVENEVDWTKNWGRHSFGEALLAVVFRAGLKTLSENTELVAEHGPLKAVIQSLVVPISARFETAFETGTINGQIQLERIRDTLLPELTAAAVNALAANHQGLFGARLEKDQPALTAVVGGILDELASGGPIDSEDVFSREVLLTVWRGGLGVVTAHPELFVDANSDPATASARTRRIRGLVGVIAKRLSAVDPILLADRTLDRNLLLGVAGLVLDVVKDSVPLLLDQGKPWENVAGDLSIAVIDSLQSGLGAGGLVVAVRRLGSREQLIEFVGVFLRQAATTPGMLVGESANDELKAVIAAVASSMAVAGADLVHPAGWLAVASAAAEAASRNPQRLFKLGSTAEAQLGAQVIGTVLRVASDEFAARGRTGGAFLFGPTLVEILQRSLAEATSNAEAAASPEGRKRLDALLRRLARLGAERTGRLGARELRWLFATLAVQALAGRDFSTVSDADLLAMLARSSEPAALLVA